MAKLYLGINRGQQVKDVVKGSSTTGKDIELVLDDSKGLFKSEIIQKLEEIKQVLMTRKDLAFKVFIAATLLFLGITRPVDAAVMQSKEIVASVNTIPTNYDVTNAGSHMLFNTSIIKYVRKLCCSNNTSSTLTAYTSNGLATTSPTFGTRDWFIFPNSGRCMRFTTKRNDLTIQWRSHTGSTVVTGSVICDINDDD